MPVPYLVMWVIASAKVRLALTFFVFVEGVVVVYGDFPATCAEVAVVAFGWSGS